MTAADDDILDLTDENSNTSDTEEKCCSSCLNFISKEQRERQDEEMVQWAIRILSEDVISETLPENHLGHLSFQKAVLVWIQAFSHFLQSHEKLHRAKQFFRELTFWLKEQG